MGWDSSRRRESLPADWAKRRAACLKRAGYRCEHLSTRGQRCKRPATDADHRIHPDNHDALQALCDIHHKAKTSQEKHAALRAKYHDAKRRPTEAHPGILTPRQGTRGTPPRGRLPDRRA